MASEFIIYQIPIFNKPYNKQLNAIDNRLTNVNDYTKEYFRRKSSIFNYQVGFLEVKYNGCSIDYNLYLKINSSNKTIKEHLFAKTKYYYQFIGMSTSHTNITIHTNNEIIENITKTINKEKDMLENQYKVYLYVNDFLQLIKIIDFQELRDIEKNKNWE